MLTMLAQQGKKVLLSTYSNLALDNVLLKMLEMGQKECFVRFGRLHAVHTEIRPYLLDSSRFENAAALGSMFNAKFDPLLLLFSHTPLFSPSASPLLPEYIESKSIFACTCLSVTNPLIASRMFDFCIIDEASQITQPICIGPLLLSKTFVLVGDIYQLPAVVRDEDALSGGLAESMFSRLSSAHPSAAVTLNTQYRMNKDICQISADLIYSGQLVCGNDEVAQRLLVLPKFATLPQPRSIGTSLTKLDWLSTVLDPK
jgi:DNA replication ATP-dependent helicase Dna2